MAENRHTSAADTSADQAGTTDRMATKASDAIASMKTSIHDTVDNVANRADAATRWAADKIDAVRQTPSDILEAGAEYIRANPYTAVGVALAVGYLFGRIGRHI